MKQWSLLILSVVLVACGGGGGGGSSTKAKPKFELLPRASAGNSAFIYHISADGSLVFGDQSAGQHPILWNASGTPSEFVSSSALTIQSVSAVTWDDRTFIGNARRADGTDVPILYRSGTSIDEVPLAPGASKGYGVDLSADGTVALCIDQPQYNFSTPIGAHPYLVKNGAATYLPVPEDAAIVLVRALSADGSTVVGLIDKKPVRWINGGTPEAVGGVEALAAGSPIYDLDVAYVSHDGKTLAGTLSLGTGLPVSGTIAFRWTASQGAQALPTPSNTEGVARGLSADGKTVLLSVYPNEGGAIRPYLWTEKSGTQSAVDLFAKAGGDPTTFTGTQAMAFSADGKTIAGNSIITDTTTAQAGNWKLTLP